MPSANPSALTAHQRARLLVLLAKELEKIAAYRKLWSARQFPGLSDALARIATDYADIIEILKGDSND